MTTGINYLPIPELTSDDLRRLWVKVNQTGGPDACWPWKVGCTSQGYASFNHLGHSYVAHRLIFALVNGPIESGLQIDHQCHNEDAACTDGVMCPHRRCCNPKHLRAATAQVNTLNGRSLQAKNAAKTHCDRNHPLSGPNLYTPPKADGRRYCRACRALAAANRYRKEK